MQPEARIILLAKLSTRRGVTLKLQISFELTSIEDAVAIAKDVAEFGDILEVGSLLLLSKGVRAIEAFRTEFPDHTLLADAKLCDRASDMVNLCVDAGANYVTVLAGTDNRTILRASDTAHNRGAKISLDLVDAYSMGQSARDAKSLGADIVLFHRSHDGGDVTKMTEQWQFTKGNTEVPIFISGNITKEKLDSVVTLGADGVVVGAAIVDADNPAEEAAFFHSRLR